MLDLLLWWICETALFRPKFAPVQSYEASSLLDGSQNLGLLLIVAEVKLGLTTMSKIIPSAQNDRFWTIQIFKLEAQAYTFMQHHRW